MARHRNVRFVSMDSTKLETSIENRFDIKPVDGTHHFVHFTRYNPAVNAKVRLGQDDFPLYEKIIGVVHIKGQARRCLQLKHGKD